MGEHSAEKDAGLRERIEALADRMEPGLMGTPQDCSDRCWDGPCDCSGVRPVFAWSGVTPDDLRAIARDLPPGADGGASDA